MHCEQISEQFADYLAGTLKEPERLFVESHLSNCLDCQSALTLWHSLNDLPVERPRPEMKVRFQDFLWSNASIPSSGVIVPSWKSVWTWTAAATLLIFGWLSGRYLPWPSATQSEEVAVLRGEIRTLRETVILSMLRQESASDRLKGVLTSTALNRPDANVTQALLETLHRDPNVNVRLAAIDALKRFSSDQSVKTGFLSGLSVNDSPLVQIALIDALVELRERQMTPVLKQLETNTETDNIVRQKARLALEEVQ